MVILLFVILINLIFVVIYYSYFFHFYVRAGGEATIDISIRCCCQNYKGWGKTQTGFYQTVCHEFHEPLSKSGPLRLKASQESGRVKHVPHLIQVTPNTCCTKQPVKGITQKKLKPWAGTTTPCQPMICLR